VRVLEGKRSPAGRLGAVLARGHRAAVAAVLAVPVAASGIVAAPASAAVSYRLTHAIGVGGDPQGVAVDPATRTVYVANSGFSTVSVINGATNTVTHTITVGDEPNGVAVDPAIRWTHTAYAVSGWYSSASGFYPEGTVSVISRCM
jgi:YVTN family beta-propeller protein